MVLGRLMLALMFAIASSDSRGVILDESVIFEGLEDFLMRRKDGEKENIEKISVLNTM